MAVFVRHLDTNEKPCFSKIWMCGDDWLVEGVHAPPYPQINHRVAGYCNGLFCLEYDDRSCVVWNPSRNEFKSLPQSQVKPAYCNCNFNCSVTVISRVCGLGFDPESGDYKVVRLVSNYFSDNERGYNYGCRPKHEAEVYSLKNDRWKEIKSLEYDIGDECATNVNGFCCWVAMRRDECNGNNRVIVALDLSKEKFSVVRFPEVWTHYDAYGYFLMEFNKGKLGVVIYERCSRNQNRFVRWVSEGGFTPRPRWIMITDPETNIHEEAERPLGFCGESRMFVEGFDCRLMVYDSVGHKLTKFDQIYHYPQCMQPFTYAESKVELGSRRRLQSKSKLPRDTSARTGRLLKMKLLKRV